MLETVPKIQVGALTAHTAEIYWGPDKAGAPRYFEALYMSSGNRRGAAAASGNSFGSDSLLSASSALYISGKPQADRAVSGDSINSSNSSSKAENNNGPFYQLTKSRVLGHNNEEGFENVYEGTGLGIVATGLIASCKFKFRLKMKLTENSPWLSATSEADVTMPDEAELNRATTSLVWAVEARSPNEVSRILTEFSGQINVDTTDKTGKSMLMVASSQGYADIAAVLLQHRANPNAKTAAGKTPLMLGASNGFPDVVRLLIRHDANVDQVDNTGSTALIWAAQNAGARRRPNVGASGGSGSSGGGSGHSSEHPDSVLRSYMECIDVLVGAGANINATDGNGLTALDMVVTSTGNADIAEFLIARGAKVIETPIKGRNNGKTTLYSAVVNGRFALVKLLIEKYNGDWEQKNEFGYSLADVAIASGNPRMGDYFKKMLEERDLEQ